MTAVASSEMARPFTVLVVCTANLCRSPIAEHILRDALERRRLDWEIVSAGSRARPDQAMHDLTRRTLEEYGIAVASNWRSTALTPGLIERADLILTATAAHRSLVVQMSPRALRRTYPLLQFARYARQLPPTRVAPGEQPGAELIVRVNQVRGRFQPVSATADDLLDPVNRPATVFRRCGQIVAEAVETTLYPLALTSI